MAAMRVELSCLAVNERNNKNAETAVDSREAVHRSKVHSSEAKILKVVRPDGYGGLEVHPYDRRDLSPDTALAQCASLLVLIRPVSSIVAPVHIPPAPE